MGNQNLPIPECAHIIFWLIKLAKKICLSKLWKKLRREKSLWKFLFCFLQCWKPNPWPHHTSTSPLSYIPSHSQRASKKRIKTSICFQLTSLVSSICQKKKNNELYPKGEMDLSYVKNLYINENLKKNFNYIMCFKQNSELLCSEWYTSRPRNRQPSIFKFYDTY